MTGVPVEDEGRITAWVADGIAHLRLDRPKVRNAIDAETVRQAKEAIAGFATQGINVGVLEASGPVFCAGGDRSEAGTTLRSASRLVEVIVASPLYWASRVQGGAVGGGVSLAAVCALPVLTPEAWLDIPEVTHGYLPTAVLVYLEPLVGARRALELCLHPERIGPEQAVALGLAAHVVPGDAIDAFILERLAPLARSAKIANAARATWQSQFATQEFLDRRDYLMSLL